MNTSKLNDDYYMSVAIQEARKALEKGEVPIGAILVFNNKIISRAHNLKENLKNPLKHAELICIEKAVDYLNNWRLNKCTIYVTMEPCLMCLGAIYEARISRLVYGLENTMNSTSSIISKSKYNHNLQIQKGILLRENIKLMSAFFNKLRQNE